MAAHTLNFAAIGKSVAPVAAPTNGAGAAPVPGANPFADFVNQFVAPVAAAAPATGTGNGYKANGKPMKPDAKVWGNPGLMIPVKKADGTIERKFIKIPGSGFAIDTADRLTKGANSTKEWCDEVDFTNWLLDTLGANGLEMPVGDTMIVEEFQIVLQLRHAGKATEQPVDLNANALVDGFKSMLAAKAPDESPLAA